ncbi:LytR C-terminal domain-containing protein [Microgenomates group bacterium]|nr:LytR C-terminal domain-containing protein [Microgenomates group bacterium]
MKAKAVRRRQPIRPVRVGAHEKVVGKRKKEKVPKKRVAVRRTKSSLMNKKSLERKKQKWGNVLATIGLLVGVLLLGLNLIVNFLLPSIFSLEDNYNLLIVNKSGPQIVLVHFNTEFRVIKEVAIDPELKIKDFAGEEKMVGELLAEMVGQGRDEQFLTAQYSFALEESLDEVLLIEKESGAWDEKLEKRELQKILWTKMENQSSKRMFFFLNRGVSWSFDTLTDASWRRFARESFSKRWRNRQCSIAVLNATETSGLAQKIWNLLHKDGHKMMKMANFGEQLEKTTIYYDAENSECLPIVQRAMRVLPLMPEIVDDGGGVANRNKASIVVVAGKDLTE